MQITFTSFKKYLKIPEIINSKINIRELPKNAADLPLLAENTDSVNILGIEISETWNLTLSFLK